MLQRIAWQSHEPDVGHAITRTLVAALKLSPRRADAVQSYTTLVSVLVDLLSARDESPTATELIAEVCEQVVVRVRFFVPQQVDVLQLLQLLAQVAEFAPDALWNSRFLFACAHVLVAICDSEVEKQLLLEVIRPVLQFGFDQDVHPARVVYVECLVIPLISTVATHSKEASPLLQLVLDMQAQRGYAPSQAEMSRDHELVDEDSAHLDSFLRLIDDDKRCSSWLATLFGGSSGASVKKASDSAEELWLSLLLGTLLFDQRRALREGALTALERQVRHDIKFWSPSTTKLLVSSLVFLASQRPASASARVSSRLAGFLSRSFFVLGSLAATTTDSMKIILRFIKRMNSVVSMQPMALKLLFVVWEQESRVYPRLEALLYQETSESTTAEYELVKVSTIESLCKKDPELGVEYISQIQAFLEDERVSVAAMALNAIEALCKADCLDFYAAFKIISLKVKKKKLQCIEAPLFLERLCVFYRLGAAEVAANKRQATKLLAHLWELAGNAASTVRSRAYESLNSYSLAALGLCVEENRRTVADDNSEDEDEVTEDDVEERIDELLECIKTEPADDVRSEIEKLLARVFEFESLKFNSGASRGQANVSTTVNDQRLQQRVSAAATKEVKKKFPLSRDVMTMCGVEKAEGDWDAFLVAFEEKEVVEYSSVKRKDKLVKIATQNVVDMEANLAAAVSQQEMPWRSADGTCDEFLRVLSLMEGWQAFMYKYVESVDELSSLKMTVGASQEDGDQFFADHISAQVGAIQDNEAELENEQRALVALGALIGRLRDCKRWSSPHVLQLVSAQIEKLCGRLARAGEEVKVFPTESHQFTVASAVVGLHLSLGSRGLDSTKEAMTAAHFARVESVFAALMQDSRHAIVRAVSSLGISHLGWLYSISISVDDGKDQVPERVKGIAVSVLAASLRGTDAVKAGNRALAARVFSSEKVDPEMVSTLSTQRDVDDVMTWGSLMGLARLSTGFASIRQLEWLMNLKTVLSHVWCEDKRAAVFGVALAPVLLESVAFDLVPAAEVERFVQTSLERLKTSSGDQREEAFHLLPLHFAVSRAVALGCTVRDDQLRELVERTREYLQRNPKTVCEVGVASVANFFHLSLGIRSLGDGPMRSLSTGSLELACNPSDVESLLEGVHSLASSSEFARFALGAISTTRELYFVSQKKKTFDAEVLALPSRGLLFKAMNALRQEQELGEHKQLVASLLDCLTATSAHLPPLDYESPVRRLIKRFCDVDVTVRCIQLAMTQGICDVYTVDDLYDPKSVVNSDARVQSALVSGLLQLAGRVGADTLSRLMTSVSNVVLEAWGSALTESFAVVETWIAVLAKLLERDNTHRVSVETRDEVKRVVIEHVLPKLPAIDPADRVRSALVRDFAREVLSQIPRQDGVENFVLGTTPEMSSPMHGHQMAAILAELVRSGAVFAPEKQTGVVVQWVLRQDFTRWTPASSAAQVQLLNELASYVLPSEPSRKQLQADTISWVHELIDAISSTVMAASGAGNATRRRALFTFLACVCASKFSLSFEHAATTRAAGSEDAVSPFVRVFPAAVMHEFGRVDSIVERLWQLHQLVQRVNLKAEALKYAAVLRAVLLLVHVRSGGQVTSERVKQPILHFWSVHRHHQEQ